MFGLGMQEILILLVIGFMLTVPAIVVIVVVLLNRSKMQKRDREQD